MERGCPQSTVFDPNAARHAGCTWQLVGVLLGPFRSERSRRWPPAEPEFEDVPQESGYRSEADSDAAAAMAAFSGYQQRIEEEQEQKTTTQSTPPIQD